LVKPHTPEGLLELVKRLQQYWLELNHGPERLS